MGLLLALFALTFKASLPPGFMLDASAGSQVAIVLCDGASAVLNLDHGSTPARDSTDQHCPFALGSAPALAEVQPYISAPATFASVDAASPIEAAVGVHQATGPPLPARGPPIQA
ncbi:hypothetical protein ATE48_07310 [Candidatus Viadribacter manganicus]|uniref:DUF2946 domain-containing protein n=1 Tax=Candidatus Viadribacter manganicus TaxID=1759059 RepID=A0A1B1AGP9_9PROT|nr:hypothetical protein ATE48_07310 [Candidatus Viadribacter manganicus]